ncbi:putative tRNA(His) guanylyltransferase-like protein, partial [Dinothrombium tinctorium]
MAKSNYAYVRKAEEATDHCLLPACFIVVRIDGQNFHHFAKTHRFFKPNDKRALDLMVDCAQFVMKQFYPNIIIAYGQSDEFSFVFRRETDIYKRRQSKITSLVVSSFSSAFVFYWNKYFHSFEGESEQFNTSLQYPPSFDSRCVLYATDKELMDYLKWRQVDCHVNNLYNTTLSAMTGEYSKWPLEDNRPKHNHKYYTSKEATKKLSGTFSSDKHEIMFTEYNINYNNELEQFKK